MKSTSAFHKLLIRDGTVDKLQKHEPAFIVVLRYRRGNCVDAIGKDGLVINHFVGVLGGVTSLCDANLYIPKKFQFFYPTYAPVTRIHAL